MRAAGHTLQTIGDKYGLTRERVRQLINKSKRASERTVSTTKRKALALKIVAAAKPQSPAYEELVRRLVQLAKAN